MSKKIEFKSKEITTYEHVAIINEVDYYFRVIPLPLSDDISRRFMLMIYKVNSDSRAHTNVTNMYCSSVDECGIQIERYVSARVNWKMGDDE